MSNTASYKVESSSRSKETRLLDFFIALDNNNLGVYMIKIFKKIAMICALTISYLAIADDHAREITSTVYGQGIQLKVTDPAAMAAALTKFRNSETGKKYPGTMLLNQMIAGGESEITHQLITFFPSAASMDAGAEMTVPGNADFMAAYETVQSASEVVGRNLSRLLRGRGSVSTPGAVTNLIQLQVTDAAAFMEAFDKLWDSKSFKEFPGGVYFGDAMGGGENLTTHFVSFVAPNMEALYEGMDAIRASSDMAAYTKNANSFRNVTGNYVTRTLMRSVGEY